MTIALKNNFDIYKGEFESKTGLKVKENMREYIAYCRFRSEDAVMQLMVGVLQELANSNNRLIEISQNIQKIQVSR